MLLDNSLFNKIVMRRVHPDKNPLRGHEDTLFVKGLRDKLTQNTNAKNVANDKAHIIQSIVHKTTIGF